MNRNHEIYQMCKQAIKEPSLYKEIKNIELEEMVELLNSQCDEVIIQALENYINKSNYSFLFDKISNNEGKKSIKVICARMEDFKVIKGTVNIKNNSFKMNDISYQCFLNNLKEDELILDELVSFKNNLELLGEEITTIEGVLKLENGLYHLKIGNSLDLETNERTSFWNSQISAPLKASMLIGVLFGSNFAMADESDAVKYATKAAMAQPEVKEFVDQTIQSAEKRAKQVVEATGSQVPVTVIGYGIKSAIDQKVELNGKKALRQIGIPMDYNIAVGFDSSYSIGLGGSNPLINKSTYKIEGTQIKGEQKIELKLNFDF